MEIQPLCHLNVDNDGLEIWLLFRLLWMFFQSVCFLHVNMWVSEFELLMNHPVFSNLLANLWFPGRTSQLG